MIKEAYNRALKRNELYLQAYKQKQFVTAKAYDQKHYWRQPYFQKISKKHHIYANNIWLLLVGNKHHQHGEYYSDKDEPFCVEAMKSALLFVLDTLETELTPDFIKLVFSLAIDGVKGLNPMEQTDEVSSYENALKHEFNPGKMPYAYTKKRHATLSGFDELDYWSNNQDVDLHLGRYGLTSKYNSELCEALERKFFIRGTSKLHSHSTKTDEQLTTELLKQYVTEYYSSLKRLKNQPSKAINAIAKLVRKIDFLHPFIDANLRTCVIIYQKLLLENNLAPTCVEDPNWLDVQASLEFAKEILKGQKYWIKRHKILKFNA